MVYYQVKTKQGNVVLKDLREINNLVDQHIEFDSITMFSNINGKIKEYKLF